MIGFTDLKFWCRTGSAALGPWQENSLWQNLASQPALKERKKTERVPLDTCARTGRTFTRFPSFKLHWKPSSEEVKAGPGVG